MRKGKRLLALALTAALCLLPGCRGKEKSQSIRGDLQQRVEGLDPQFSTSWESRVVTLNLFEGLLTRDGEGKLVPGAAERYEVSPDGLTFTFRLRRDGVWNDGNRQEGEAATPVTAHDFVFAFRRMFDPQVPSPWEGDFRAIRNAAQVLAGELPPEELGVRALDDYTLEITLSTPSPVFPELLAGPGALPCNEEFFRSTRARYGQTAAHILSNGPFSLSSWDEEAVVLVPSGSYTGTQRALCPSVVLYTGRAKRLGTTQWDLFLEGKADFCAATGSQAQGLDPERFRVAPAEDTVWALVFRQDPDSPLADQDIRRALALTVNPDGFGDRVPEQLQVTRSLVPRSATLMGTSYGELVQPPSLKYRPQEAAAALALGLERLGIAELPKTTLLLPESAGLGALGGYLQKRWREDLHQFVNLEILEDGEFQRRLAAGEFQMAIAPLEAGGSSPMNALEAFSSGSSRNLAASNDPQYDQLLYQAQTAPDIHSAAWYCTQCEKMLLDQAVAAPLLTQQGYWATGAGVTGLAYQSDSIRFAGALRVHE